MAGWMAIIGSAFIVVAAFEYVGRLRTVQGREAVAESLRDSAQGGLGLPLDDWLQILHVSSLVTAACAAAAGILAWYALRRDRSARVGLAVVALPLFVAGTMTNNLLTAFVAVSAVLLWTQPARDWFDGVTRPEPRPAGWPPLEQTQPRADTPAGAPTESAFEAQPTPAKPAQAARPAAVRWACVATWVGCALTALIAMATGLVVAGEPQPLIDTLRRGAIGPQEQYPDALFLASFYFYLAVVVAVAAATAAVAGFVWRRHDWARILLLVLSCVAVVAGILSGFWGLPAFVTALLTIGLLRRSDVAAWFARR